MGIIVKRNGEKVKRSGGKRGWGSCLGINKIMHPA
jgi:hypothetical protein